MLVLPYINMNPPRMYRSSQSWTPLPPPSPYHPSGSSQCTSPKHPVSCIEPRLEILSHTYYYTRLPWFTHALRHTLKHTNTHIIPALWCSGGMGFLTQVFCKRNDLRNVSTQKFSLLIHIMDSLLWPLQRSKRLIYAKYIAWWLAHDKHTRDSNCC